MKKMVISGGLGVGFVLSLFIVAGRGVSEVGGFLEASADIAADSVTATISDEIHDRKLDHELDQAKSELLDRQTQVLAFRPQISELKADVERLVGRTERRARLLAEAFPVIRDAEQHGATTVRFANEDRAIELFRCEVDQLLGLQDREQRQLDLKQTALARLVDTVEQADLAITEMRGQLDESEHNVALLRSRREQAKIEADTLSLMAAATAEKDSAAGVMAASLNLLEKQVAQLESRNEARRSLSSDLQPEQANKLAQQWDRMSQLEKIYDASMGSANAGKRVSQLTKLPSKDSGKDAVQEIESATEVSGS